MAASQRSGWESAYWMGRRMSVTPSWASTVPSTNSTIECTTDCGWISTSMRSGGTSKSQRASMTSSPLFMRVAESMVILRPMDQVGWLSASAGVIASKVSRGARAEGAAGRGEHEPPHLFRPAAVQALVQRAVLAVDGQQAAAAGARLRDHQLARHHQRLLVGEGHVLARLQRAVGRHQADRAHRRRHHQSRRRRAWRPRPRPPRPTPTAGPERSTRRASSLARRRRWPPRPPAAGSARPARPAARRWRPAASPTTSKRSGNASTTRRTLQPTEPVEPRMERPFGH